MSGVDREPPAAEASQAVENESGVMGVTEDSDSAGEHFTRASHLYACSNCSRNGLVGEQIRAVRPRDHAVMLCKECCPNPPGEWL